MTVRAATTALLFAYSSTAGADVDVPQELVLGELAAVQGAWELQLTLSPSYSRDDEDLYGLGLLAELGLTDRLQVELEVPGGHLRAADGTATGIGNIELGALYALVTPEGPGLGFSAGIQAAFPSLTEQLGPRAFAVEPLVVAELGAGSWHAALLLGAEIGLGAVGESEPETRQAEVEPELALATFARVQTFAFALELFGELEDDPVYQLSPGVFWHPLDAFEIGLGVPIGLSDAAPDYAIVALVTWEYELRD